MPSTHTDKIVFAMPSRHRSCPHASDRSRCRFEMPRPRAYEFPFFAHGLLVSNGKFGHRNWDIAEYPW